MKGIKFLLVISLLTLNKFLFAQDFLSPQPNRALTFKEMQLQFNDWKNTRNIAQERGWKHFKRWEMETQMHTNGEGNPVSPEVFINEVSRLAAEKEIIKAKAFSEGEEYRRESIG